MALQKISAETSDNKMALENLDTPEMDLPGRECILGMKYNQEIVTGFSLCNTVKLPNLKSESVSDTLDKTVKDVSLEGILQVNPLSTSIGARELEKMLNRDGEAVENIVLKARNLTKFKGYEWKDIIESFGLSMKDSKISDALGTDCQEGIGSDVATQPIYYSHKEGASKKTQGNCNTGVGARELEKMLNSDDETIENIVLKARHLTKPKGFEWKHIIESFGLSMKDSKISDPLGTDGPKGIETHVATQHSCYHGYSHREGASNITQGNFNTGAGARELEKMLNRDGGIIGNIALKPRHLTKFKSFEWKDVIDSSRLSMNDSKMSDPLDKTTVNELEKHGNRIKEVVRPRHDRRDIVEGQGTGFLSFEKSHSVYRLDFGFQFGLKFNFEMLRDWLLDLFFRSVRSVDDPRKGF